MDLEVPATDLRAFLLQQLIEFAGDRSEAERAPLVAQASAVLSRTTDAELEALVRRVQCDDYEFDYHPPVELARVLHHTIADLVLTPDSVVSGREHLQSVSDNTLILLPNHVSFSDANIIEVLLHRAGFDSVCRRLTVVAGPKVYSDSWRRFASLCFGTIKTAQSTQRASGEAVMRPRDVARIAQRTIACAFERLDAGDALLLFAEGTRSRDATLQALLPAVARYCERPNVWLVPLGVTGSEKLFGFDDTRLQRNRVTLRIGPPLAAAELRARCGGNRPKIAEALWHMIAQCLPPAYRGAYA